LSYQLAVLDLYLGLPEASGRIGPSDQQQARQWLEAGVSLPIVETALLLGSLRRLLRPGEAPRLAPIRSLAYFRPVVEELLETPVPDSYRAYLPHRIQAFLRAPAGAPPAGC
jgi:hypothetical protein